SVTDASDRAPYALPPAELKYSTHSPPSGTARSFSQISPSCSVKSPLTAISNGGGSGVASLVGICLISKRLQAEHPIGLTCVYNGAVVLSRGLAAVGPIEVCLRAVPWESSFKLG